MTTLALESLVKAERKYRAPYPRQAANATTVDIHGNWKLTVRGSGCGQEISVAGAIDMNHEPGKRVFVITVFGSD